MKIIGRRLSVLIGAFLLAASFATFSAATAAASTHLTCSTGNGNFYVGSATAQRPRTQTAMTGRLTTHNMSLCSPIGADPESGSSIWVALQGPNTNDIVQIGIAQCAVSTHCNGVGNSPHYFYAYGYNNCNGQSVSPVVHNLGVATAGETHTYWVGLNSGGTFIYFMRDNVVLVQIAVSVFCWFPNATASLAGETFNYHDENAGSSTTKQHATSLQVVNSGTSSYAPFTTVGSTCDWKDAFHFCSIISGTAIDLWTFF